MTGANKVEKICNANRRIKGKLKRLDYDDMNVGWRCRMKRNNRGIKNTA